MDQGGSGKERENAGGSSRAPGGQAPLGRGAELKPAASTAAASQAASTAAASQALKRPLWFTKGPRSGQRELEAAPRRHVAE